MSDPQKYRTKEELESKKNDDPILRLKAHMLEHKIATHKDLDGIDDDVKDVVLKSVQFAEKSPAPDLSSIYEDVYDETDYPFLA